MSPLAALVALNMLSGIGPIRCRRLLHVFGSATRILAATVTELQQVRGIGSELARQIASWQQRVDPLPEIEECRQRGIQILTSQDCTYPRLLKQINDSPIVLYCQGKIQTHDQLAVAVVGTRRCSHYGIQISRQLSYQLAANGVTILSGLARGIDTAAHEAALAAGGRTISVIGSGLAQIYPGENQALAETIADGRGAVLSEYPLHTRPDKHTFPMRNRVIAACSQAILVVECPLRSGAQITANQAAEYGRPVYAVPGPIDRPSFAGSHALIREGATLISNAAELLEELGSYRILPTTSEPDTAESSPPLDNTAGRILAAIDSCGATIDQLVEHCQLPAASVSKTLLELELRGQVQAKAGATYVRAGSTSR